MAFNLGVILKKYWMFLNIIIISIIFGIIFGIIDSMQHHEVSIFISSLPILFVSGFFAELLNKSEKITKSGLRLITLAVFELIVYAIVWSNDIFHYDPLMDYICSDGFSFFIIYPDESRWWIFSIWYQKTLEIGKEEKLILSI